MENLHPTNWPFSPDDSKSAYSHKTAQQIRAVVTTLVINSSQHFFLLLLEL